MRAKYESLSATQLKEVAKARGLKGISALKKEELVERMVAEDTREAEKEQEKQIEEKKAEFKEAGLEAIRACKVAAILLAGGQGTRLGFDKAKGMYNIGVNKDLYIFEQLLIL